MDLGVMQMWVLIPLLPLTALNDVGQIIWYFCPSFLISKMGEAIFTTSKLCIVEMYLACSKYSMTMLWLSVLSNRKLVLVLYFLDLYVTASLSIPFLLKKPLVFLYLN